MSFYLLFSRPFCVFHEGGGGDGVDEQKETKRKLVEKEKKKRQKRREEEEKEENVDVTMKLVCYCTSLFFISTPFKITLGFKFLKF